MLDTAGDASGGRFHRHAFVGDVEGDALQDARGGGHLCLGLLGSEAQEVEELGEGLEGGRGEVVDVARPAGGL